MSNSERYVDQRERFGLVIDSGRHLDILPEHLTAEKQTVLA